MDMADIIMEDTPSMVDDAAILRIPHTTTTSKDTTSSGENTATSKSRFAIISENTDNHHPCPKTICQSPISAILEIKTSPLEENPTTAGCSDRVTFGNDHNNISHQMCKTTSGEADVQDRESSSPSMDITLNADPTASVNISGNVHIPSVSYEDDTASPNKVALAGSENITTENITTGTGNPCVTPINMITNKDNVASSSGSGFISTTVLGDFSSATNSEEATSDPGDISNVASGEKTAGSADTFSSSSTGDLAITAPSLGSTLVFMDCDNTWAIPGPEDHATIAVNITTAPDDFKADPVSDSGEISHTTYKEASASLPGDVTVLLQGGTAGEFTTDTSGIIPTFSATTDYITHDQGLPVVSGRTNDLTHNDSNMAVAGTHVTVGPKGSFTSGNKTDTLSRKADATVSPVPPTTPRGAYKAFTDGLNLSRSTTNAVSLETTQCPVTTDSGDASVITGNIRTTHFDIAIINESFPGNVSTTVGTSDTIIATPGKKFTTSGKKPATSMIHGDTSATHNGETSSRLSCGNSMKAASLTEVATDDPEDSTTEPDSITVSGDSNATVGIAITGLVDNTAREVVATSPENTNQMESSSSPQNGIVIIDGESLTTNLIKISGDSTTKASFGGNTASPGNVDTNTTATQEYAFTNAAGHVKVNYGSIRVSGGFNGDKVTTTGLGGNAIPENATSMMHGENYASITSASESQDITMNIATTTSSQDACELSAKSQAGQDSKTIARKTSTIFGSSSNIHRDMDTTEVTLTSPPNTVTTAAAITNTTITLENDNNATSGMPPTSQNINDMISEVVTTSPMSQNVTEYMESRNMTTIQAESAVTTVATSASFGKSTNTTSSPPRETTCSTGNDTMETSGSSLSVCVLASATGKLPVTVLKETPISIGKPIHEFTGMHGDHPKVTASSDSASAHKTGQDMYVAILADDSKTPSDTSSPNIFLLSREHNTSALEDAASKVSDSASITATTSGDTSEEAEYEGRITSGHSGTETILGCVSTPHSSFSIRTNFQEASKGPDTTTLLGYTNIIEDVHISHEFASVQCKSHAVLVQTPKFTDTATILGGYTSTEATRQNNESVPTANAASPSVDDKIQSETVNTPDTIGIKNTTNKSLLPDSISTSVISGIFEATPVPKESSYTTAILDANTAFSAGVTAIIPTTNSKGATAPGGSGEFMKTTTLLKDTTTFTTTSTGATATVTALKDTVMTTQTSMRDISPVSRNKTTTILEDASTLRETVTSEKMAAATAGNIMAHSEVLIPGTSFHEGISDSNINPKEIFSNYSSDYYIDRITSDSLATTNIINILSDVISTPNNASSLLEITTSPEGISASRNNCTTTNVQISIQSQTTMPEAPCTVTEMASFSTEKYITIITTREAGIAHAVPIDATISNTSEDESNSSVTTNYSENATNIAAPSVSLREVDAVTCIPLDMTSSALEISVPSGHKFCSKNDANTTTTLEEVCAHPDYSSPTEALSTPACTSLGDTRHLVELVTPCLSTISISEYTSKISETSTGSGNAITPILSLQGSDQSITTNSIATTGIAALTDPKSVTIAPGTTLDGSRDSIASSTPEHVPTAYGATDTYTGGKTIRTDLAKYMIVTPIIPEETITASGDHIPDLAVLKDQNMVTTATNLHTRILTAHEETIYVDGDATSGPATYEVDARLIPSCTVTISLRETLIPSGTTTSKDTDTSAATTIVGRSTTATTDDLGKCPTPEMTMVMEETAVSGIITSPRETFVAKTAASFTEAHLARSATEFPLSFSSEATVFPAEMSTVGATFTSGQAAASRNASSNKSVADEDLIAMTTSSSPSPSVNIPFTPFSIGRTALIVEDEACSAPGHPYTPENQAITPENVDTTVPEDPTITSGNTDQVSEGPIIIKLGKDAESPAKEISTIEEGDFIIATETQRDTINSTTTTESSVTTRKGTTVVPGESPTIDPGEKTTAIYPTPETYMITGWTNDKTGGEILTATPRETSLATLEKAKDSTTRETFVAPGEARIIPFATFRGITGTPCTSTSQISDPSHEDAPAIPEETVTAIPRETAPVTLGKAKGTTTIIHRKISTAVLQNTFTNTSYGASPGEIPAPSFAVAACKVSPLPGQSCDTHTGVTPEDTSVAAPSKTASTSQTKHRTVISLPYWFIILTGMTVIVFLLAGFCMVIYYVTVFALVAFSASLSSNTFS